MRPTLYTIDHPEPGSVSIMARPRGFDWIADEMAALAASEVDVVVCALTQPELDTLGLAGEAEAARAAGLRHIAMPIPDRQVPEMAAVLPTLTSLADDLREGAHIATHCRYGIGRASLLAAALLVLNGTTPQVAWTRIQHARGLPVPDTAEQREWTKQLTRRS
ncbi:tyrosine protein phosphatase [Frankia sp. CNm7]|nr:tyrosine protein phosphatase [Frankia nepalensis]MBL7509332.1 tyrosine protein phosphatase [Frankia nepalensis]MBL7516880.1 tyrosine protein phosphatase [Frankia nepalensis]